jgi:hypothetical protein
MSLQAKTDMALGFPVTEAFGPEAKLVFTS